MSQKRKATGDLPSPKRLQKLPTLDDDVDPIYREKDSDVEYEFSDSDSEAGDSLHETPATPMSTTSSRYPSELKTHRCPFDGCTKAFNRPARLQEHLRSHNNERLFQCPHDGCDKNFLRASHLNHHVKSAHTGIRDYVCDRPGCGKSFVTGSRLRRHLAAHDGRDKYRCTEYPPCDETFRKHTTLQKHILSAHLNQKPFPCAHVDPASGQRCPMAFDTAGHLRAHESRVHTEKRFACAECAQRADLEQTTTSTTAAGGTATFPSYALLQAHIRAAHPPQCPHCALTCSTTRELRRHLEVAHGNVPLSDRKVFPCTVPGCDSSFTKKGNLTVHVRTVHQGEKRFVCGETDLSASKRVAGWPGGAAHGCGKRYGSKLALEEHIRTAHMGFPNAKAERRQRLGLAPKVSAQQRSNAAAAGAGAGPSALAALTGAGYAEETGRQIPCMQGGCAHRFHRNYDLWVHMGSKHGYSEDEIRDLFMQKALLAEDGEQQSSSTGAASTTAATMTAAMMGDLFGLYGLEFDNDDDGPGYEPYDLSGKSVAAGPAVQYGNGEESGGGGGYTAGGFPSHNDMIHDIDSKIPSAANPTVDDLAMIDPLLEFNNMAA
ncbi:hypothetical protein ASPACDRAFT_117744 [Aspergillus aculeatus ATCC 16872]|uniref:C2H2-type domain-containing protein n=1 Tax=Aspergillus aculeatus (strain ATCC 16872 / CBS 172.66 / WB 5094) TaxID=690307 RepID=A0A1L9WXQ6_ASPA1|nr:uncharacterized protein ASPACDRAFT_117744 [Aspergillus aculeatus ATCC 16872]OJK01032.1 hypothetical protein ASPACDRAFT_117744 [Aspergillus aculeatus ATCC 16872]